MITLSRKSKFVHSSYFRFIANIVIWLILGISVGTKLQIADSAAYLEYFPSFFYKSDGSFSLFEYRDRLRGYSMPLLGETITRVANGINVSPLVIIILINVIILSIITALLIPQLAKKIFPNSSNGIVSFVSIFFLAFLWRGYIPYFLTDIPSAACVLACVNILLKDKLNKVDCFSLGIMLALAVNLRMSYQIAFFALILILIIRFARSFEKAKLMDHAAKYVLTFIGLLIIFLPQVLINYNFSKKIEVFPSATYYVGKKFYTTSGIVPLGNQKMEIFQVSVGLALQKFEVSKVPGSDPRVSYSEPFGKQIAKSRLPITSISQYAGIWTSHPIAMTKISIKHVLNGFDQRYSSAYIEDFDDQEYLGIQFWYAYLSLTGISVFLILFLDKNKAIKKKVLGIMVISVLAILSASLGAVEPRFFIFPTLTILGVTSGFLSSHGYKYFKKPHILILSVLLILGVNLAYTKFSNAVMKQRGPTECIGQQTINTEVSTTVNCTNRTFS